MRGTLRTLVSRSACAYPLVRGSLRRKPSAIRALQPLLDVPGMISLGGGMPNAQTFPISSIELTLKDKNNGAIKVKINEDETKAALQYSASHGLPSLTAHLRALQTTVHGVSFTDNDLIVTNGSQDGLAKAFEMLLEPHVDTLLVETPTYSGSLAFLGPASINLQGVRTDEHGMIPADLRSVLDGWEAANPGRKKPRVLYTIPTGSNPSGGSLSEGEECFL